jgi:hypothetical protein
VEKIDYLEKYILFFFFFFALLGFELRALCLLDRHSITWATLSALFCFSFYSGRTSLFFLASDHNSLTYSPKGKPLWWLLTVRRSQQGQSYWDAQHHPPSSDLYSEGDWGTVRYDQVAFNHVGKTSRKLWKQKNVKCNQFLKVIVWDYFKELATFNSCKVFIPKI